MTDLMQDEDQPTQGPFSPEHLAELWREHEVEDELSGERHLTELWQAYEADAWQSEKHRVESESSEHYLTGLWREHDGDPSVEEHEAEAKVVREHLAQLRPEGDTA